MLEHEIRILHASYVPRRWLIFQTTDRQCQTLGWSSVNTILLYFRITDVQGATFVLPPYLFSENLCAELWLIHPIKLVIVQVSAKVTVLPPFWF